MTGEYQDQVWILERAHKIELKRLSLKRWRTSQGQEKNLVTDHRRFN